MNPTLIMKPVGNRCNLCCAYCYNNVVREHGEVHVMGKEVLQQLLIGLKALEVPYLRFIWHGGEPTLAGIPFYEMVLKEQQLLVDGGIQVSNSIQTNGTLLTPEWVGFIRANKFRPSVSLDGPASVHDTNRVSCSGAGSFGRAVAGLRLLMEDGINVGVSAVVTSTGVQAPLEVYRFFRDLGISHVDFSPCAEVDSETGELFPFSVTPKAYADFMMTMFDTWFAEDDPGFRIRRFSEMIQGVIRGTQMLCEFRGECHEFLAVDWNGDVFVCGRFMGTDDMRLGNLTGMSLGDMLGSEKYLGIKAAVESTKEECRDCEWRDICRGGCSYYRYFRTGDLSAPNYYCPAYRTMFQHIAETVRPLLPQN